MILNVGVLTANKMKLGFEARSQNTRIIGFIRQILIHGIVLYEISMLISELTRSLKTKRKYIWATNLRVNKQLGVEEEYLLIRYFPDCINILGSSNMLTNGLRLKSLCKFITN